MQDVSQKLQKLPNSAGVYQYFDSNGHLLYIGKAKVLKNRVKSYFKMTPTLAPADKLSPRIHKMISEIASLEWIVVPSEHDALILENSLIKQLKPKYNILLRDDKTYPYIYIDMAEDFPRPQITRKVLKGNKIKYFGPYSSGAKALLESLYDALPLVQKKSCIKGGKACLFYQIKKCLAPCEGKISKQEYKEILDESIDLLQNKKRLIKFLEKKMEDYSEDFRFEEAMEIRNKISSIGNSEIKTSLDFANRFNIDLFAIYEGSNYTAVLVKMFVRNGKVVTSSHNYFRIKQSGFSKQEAYSRALVNYYKEEIPVVPHEVITADVLEDAHALTQMLKEKFSKNISITTPQRGKKKELVTIALENCQELLKIDAKTNSITLYQELKSLLGLETLAFRIEVFDNSHMMGQATVGAMVVWDEKFDKASYRHYNLEAKDEYAQMQEMLTRRAQSFDKNPPPDLWVIDGGATLLKLAKQIIDSSGANIDVIAIAKEKIDAKAHRAKGSAQDILYTLDKAHRLQTSDKRLQFIQKLRDEAHRFAIEFHKKQKRKEDKKISLLQIHGIGEAKVKKLLDYFGSFEKIKQAPYEELCFLLPQSDAHKIKEFFRY